MELFAREPAGVPHVAIGVLAVAAGTAAFPMAAARSWLRGVCVCEALPMPVPVADVLVVEASVVPASSVPKTSVEPEGTCCIGW